MATTSLLILIHEYAYMSHESFVENKITILSFVWFGTPTYTYGYDESTNADLRLLGHTPAVRHTTPSLGGGLAARLARAGRAALLGLAGHLVPRAK